MTQQKTTHSVNIKKQCSHVHVVQVVKCGVYHIAINSFLTKSSLSEMEKLCMQTFELFLPLSLPNSVTEGTMCSVLARPTPISPPLCPYVHSSGSCKLPQLPSEKKRE